MGTLDQGEYIKTKQKSYVALLFSEIEVEGDSCLCRNLWELPNLSYLFASGILKSHYSLT